MSVFDCFPPKENLVKRTVEIDLTLYEKLEYLSQNVYDASINKLINVCIETLIESKNLNLYSKPKNEVAVTRSLYIRKSIYKGLSKLREDYSLSYNRLINIAIRNVLIEDKIIKVKNK